jgi:hypothetical protein
MNENTVLHNALVLLLLANDADEHDITPDEEQFKRYNEMVLITVTDTIRLLQDRYNISDDELRLRVDSIKERVGVHHR